MPYRNFGELDPEDVDALIAYIRTLKPQPDEVPDRSFHFPMQILVRTLPQPAQFSSRPDTGIGTWTEAQFVMRFKIWEMAPDRVLPAKQRSTNTVMPWKELGGMTRDDLTAIYAFLRDLKPVIHRVRKRDPAPAAR